MAQTGIVSVKSYGDHWRVTIDGRALGDGRGYATRKEAVEHALQIVENDHNLARANGSLAELVFRPS